jgi:hypothetical protein
MLSKAIHRLHRLILSRITRLPTNEDTSKVYFCLP